MGQIVYIRAQILGELPSGQKLVRLLANNADGITFFASEKDIVRFDNCRQCKRGKYEKRI